MKHNKSEQSSVKRHRNLWPWIYGVLLAAYTVFTLLDAFVIPRNVVDPNAAGGNRFPQFDNPYDKDHLLRDTASPETCTPAPTQMPETTAAPEDGQTAAPTKVPTPDPTATPSPTPFVPVITETSYIDRDISVILTTTRQHDTQIYIAEVKIKDISFFRSGLAGGVFGRNILQKTSQIAAQNNAIFAVNGDYYGFRDRGFVMRNGYLYRETARTGNGNEDLAVFLDGHFEIVNESSVTAEALGNAGAMQIFSFGPGLIKNGTVAVTANSEVEQSLSSNPRTAVGMIEPLHYIFLVSDGRTDESAGLTLLQVAELMKELGCTEAYNLDGGGSSTMWFMGRIVNKPTAFGSEIYERSVSDIVYIGAE